MTRIAFDTNILAYAEGLALVAEDSGKIDGSRRVIADAILSNSCAVSEQVFLELFNVLTRKAKLPRSEAFRRIAVLRNKVDLIPTGGRVVDDAFELASRHQLQIFDAVILAAAAEAGCDVLMSEDMQAGFAWRGVTVVNPFAT